jgi:hypothetical protein
MCTKRKSLDLYSRQWRKYQRFFSSYEDESRSYISTIKMTLAVWTPWVEDRRECWEAVAMVQARETERLNEGIVSGAQEGRDSKAVSIVGLSGLGGLVSGHRAEECYQKLKVSLAPGLRHPKLDTLVRG